MKLRVFGRPAKMLYDSPFMTWSAFSRCAVAAAALAAAPGWAWGATGSDKVTQPGAQPRSSAMGATPGRVLLVPSARERRAVRGRPVLDPVEAADQAQIRRFEESLPEVAPASEPERAAGTMPAAVLSGTWSGSGDEGHATPSGAVHGTALGSGGPLAARYRDFFADEGPGRLAVGAMLTRVGPWLPKATEALTRAGVPGELLAVAVASSGFDVEARARDGRAGPWLLAAAPARAQGLRIDQWLDERRDPVRASEAAAQILIGLHQRFGTWPLALAAYHAGVEAVEAARSTLEAKADLLALLAAGSPLPRPTRLFLARTAAIVDHLGAAPLPALDATAQVVEVPGALTLETVARVLEVELSVVRQLNPGLVLDRVAPFAGLVALRVPAGTRAVAAAVWESGRASEDAVTVVPLRLGESAQALAEQRGMVPRELARFNGVREAGELRGPCELLFPAAPSTMAMVADDPDEPILVAVPPRAVEVPGAVRRFYAVSDGDSLDEIAAAAEISVADLLSWNNLDRGARLQPKMVLQVYVKPELDASRLALLDPTRVRAVPAGSDEFHALEVAQRGKTRVVHQVRPGDTIAKIARRYGLGVADLARINRMSWNSDLSNGQTVVVYAPSGGAGAQKLAAGRSVPKRGPAPVARATTKPTPKSVARPAHARPVRAAGR
jgi:membrane-bound lytic murein transglycosylase D